MMSRSGCPGWEGLSSSSLASTLPGLIRLGWLEKEYKFSITGKRSKYATSFLFGVAFAAGWTPCVGAALGAILGLAASQPAYRVHAPP